MVFWKQRNKPGAQLRRWFTRLILCAKDTIHLDLSYAGEREFFQKNILCSKTASVERRSPRWSAVRAPTASSRTPCTFGCPRFLSRCIVNPFSARPLPERFSSNPVSPAAKPESFSPSAGRSALNPSRFSRKADRLSPNAYGLEPKVYGIWPKAYGIRSKV